MLKASELRIGNYVMLHNEPTRIIEISGNTDSFSNGELSVMETLRCDLTIPIMQDSILAMEFKPIPLNEEWLTKFGFEEGNPETINRDIWALGRLNFNIQKVFSGFNLLQTQTNIRYVHELQNLYFAITHEELTIKNEVDKWDSFVKPPTLNGINKELYGKCGEGNTTLPDIIL